MLLNLFLKAGIASCMLIASAVLNGCDRPGNKLNAFSVSLTKYEPVKKHSAELVLKWYELELKLLRQKPGFAPPVAARSLGYTGIILYESIVNGMPEYQSLYKELHLPSLPVPQKQSYNWMISANAALSFSLKHFTGALSTTNLIEIDSLENYFKKKYSKQISKEQLSASAAFGNAIAAAIYSWSKTDGGHYGHRKNFSGNLSGPLLPGMWQATSFSGALLQDWGSNRPFMPANVIQCQPPPPPDYSDEKNSTLFKEAKEVYSVFQKLTSEQAQIAKFWADPPGSTFTPAGHSVQILCQIIKEKNLSLDSSVIAFAKLGIALNDAFISCWKAKYRYNYIRPITYIRKHIRKDWLPFINTPSFPEYPSGHSVQSAATAEVLSSLFGNNYSFTDYSNDTLGYTPRHYFSFDEYAREAAVSRLYGGIHFSSSVKNGLLQGKKIGANVNALRLKNSKSTGKESAYLFP
ncbi:MAG: vanadium-dependent haloperoxidase [Bacteroidota bacterium]|nr:vanadium-dependent haloperoxidase [Bacteroidota bacterium]